MCQKTTSFENTSSPDLLLSVLLASGKSQSDLRSSRDPNLSMETVATHSRDSVTDKGTRAGHLAET